MRTLPALAAACLATIVLSACQSDAQILANEQNVAMQSAVNRGRFEMGCPQAQGSVLSSNVLQPVVWGGLERAEYTIGVSGCGQQRVYVVVCQLGSPSCFAAASR